MYTSYMSLTHHAGSNKANKDPFLQILMVLCPFNVIYYHWYNYQELYKVIMGQGQWVIVEDVTAVH